jgi:hypothetical protein
VSTWISTRFAFCPWLLWLVLSNHSQGRNRRAVRCGFLFGASEADAPSSVCKIPPSQIENLISNQSVSDVTART